MYIPEEIVEQVHAATDIVEVVGDYVRMKRKGSNYFGLCPFHNEKTPSFSVNPSLGIFKCFGCGEGGNVFQFISKIEHISYPEAVRMLAERAGIPIPDRDTPAERFGEVESIQNALRFAARFYYTQLTREQAGQVGLRYFKERGFSANTIKKFGLGYAPEGWDRLMTAAAEHHISPEVLEKAGLVIRRKEGDGYYDRFRGRVIFPIFSHVGKVLGFGARILHPAEDQPKYINSPETLVYNKSRVLYGLYQAKHAIRKYEEAILVEGYTDVISLHQAGIEHVVASSGTALTVEQLKLLGRYAKRVVMLYDADSAGASAAIRGIDLALTQGLAVYAVALPPGQDPDSFVREQGAEAVLAYLNANRQDFVSFKYQQAARDGAFDTPEGRAAAMRSVVESISRVPDPLMQETFMRRAGEVLGVPDIRLYEVLRSIQQTQRVPDPNVETAIDTPQTDEPEPEETEEESSAGKRYAGDDILPEEKILHRLMLENGVPMVEYVLGHMSFDEFTEGPSRETAQHILALYEEGTVNAQKLLERDLGQEVNKLVSEVLIDRYEPSENWTLKKNISVPRLNEDAYEAAASAMVLLKLDRVNEVIRKHLEKVYQVSQEGGDLRSLNEQTMALYRLRASIEQRAFLNRHNS